MAYRPQGMDRPRTEPIAIAKIKKGGVIFEIVLKDSDLALKFRAGKDLDLKDILETPKIFSDAKRGELAAHTDMKKWLGTDNEKEVATIILRKGELSLTQEQRKQMFDAKKSKIIDYIQVNAADPKTKLPHPRIRIENAMQQAKVQIDAYKSVEEQLDGIIESLRAILPISLEKVKLIITIPAKYAGSAYSALKGKDIVVPGALLAEGLEYLPSGRAFRDGENIYAATIGLISVKGRVIKVIPLAGKYSPKRGDVIIAKINGFGKFGWNLEIDSPYKIDLNVGEISMNYVDLKNSKLADYFKIGDYVFGEITDISESGYISLSAKRRPYRKLLGGNIIKVGPTKIPRIIGKQGSMIKTLKDLSEFL